MPASYNFENFIERFQQLKSEQQDFVVVTLTKIVGSAPQDLGARAIVSRKGLEWGSVGGGKIEAWAIRKAQEIHDSNEYHEVNLQTDIGMSCGGLVGLLFEKHQNSERLKIAVFGAGHVSQELVPLLCRLEADVQVADSRLEWLEKFEPQKNLTKVHSENLAELVNSLAPNSYIISVTMGHAHDLPILKQALSKDFPYVGVIGSEVKAAKLKKELQEAGLERAKIDQLICPIGLDIGSNAPFEIAISIVAQILQKGPELSKF